MFDSKETKSSPGLLGAFRKVSRLFHVGKINPGDLVGMAVKAMEDSKMKLGKGQCPIVPDEYCITLAGDNYDVFASMIDNLQEQIASQLRAYASDAGLELNKNRVVVLISRMPSSRKGYARAEALFSCDTDLSVLQMTDPLDDISIHLDGDDRTMLFGQLSQRETWKDNYGLNSNIDKSRLEEIVKLIDAGLMEDASVLLDQLQEQNSGHNGLWILHDYISVVNGDESALKRLKSRNLLVKDDPLLSASLAIMLLEKGDLESALWEIMEALNNNLGHPVLLFVLAQAYHEMDLSNLSGEIMRQLNINDAQNPEALDLMRRFLPYRSAPDKKSHTTGKYYKIKLYDPDSKNQKLLIETRKTKILLGRKGGNINPDVEIEDDMVSSPHCQIVNNDGIFYLIDSNSRNGVFVRGERIQTKQLVNGDVFKLGNTRLVFEL